MFVAPQPSTPANRVILQWLEARSRFDIHAMDAQMARDFVSVALPAPAGKAEERGRDALWALTQSPAADLMSIEFTVYGLAENTNQVWAHTRMEAEANGVPYDVESIYIFTLDMPEVMVATPKIKKIEQFVDSAAVAKFDVAVAAKK